MHKILGYAYDIALFTTIRYLSFIEAVNLRANNDCATKLKWQFNYTHLALAELGGNVDV